MIEIAVLQDGWGEARPVDIHALLADTASHLLEPLRTPLECAVIVIPAPTTEIPLQESIIARPRSAIS